MDRLIDGSDSIEIVKALRDAGCKVPVLVISSLTSVDDRIRGLKAGGDDYLKFKEGDIWHVAEPSDREPRGPWWTAFRGGTLDALEPQVDDGNETLAAVFANCKQAHTTGQQAEAAFIRTLINIRS